MLQEILEFASNNSDFLLGAISGSVGTILTSVASDQLSGYFDRQRDKDKNLQKWYKEVEKQARTIGDSCYPSPSGRTLEDRKTDVDKAISSLKELNESDNRPRHHPKIVKQIRAVLNIYNSRIQNFDPNQQSTQEFFKPDFIRQMIADSEVLRRSADSNIK